MLKILIPVDGSENSLNAVRHVVTRHLNDSPAEIHLLHVCLPLPQSISRFVSSRDVATFHSDEAERTLAPAKALLDRFGATYVTHAEVGSKAETIHRMAKKIGADEIVIGTGRKNSFTRLIEGSVTNQVMELADVPVEVIANGEESKLEKYGLPAGIGAALTLLVVANE